MFEKLESVNYVYCCTSKCLNIAIEVRFSSHTSTEAPREDNVHRTFTVVQTYKSEQLLNLLP